MRMKRLLVLLLCGGLLPLAACESDEETAVRPTFYDKARQARDHGAGEPLVLPPQRQAYERSAEERLSEFDRRLGELQERSAALPPPQRSEAEGQLEALRHRRELARETMADLRDAGTENWVGLQEKMQTLLSELENGVRDLEGRLGRGATQK
jgi:hypothetical protein